MMYQREVISDAAIGVGIADRKEDLSVIAKPGDLAPPTTEEISELDRRVGAGSAARDARDRSSERNSSCCLGSLRGVRNPEMQRTRPTD